LADVADDGAAYLDGAHMTGVAQWLTGTRATILPDPVALSGFSAKHSQQSTETALRAIQAR
jgi:hypothetical protein